MDPTGTTSSQYDPTTSTYGTGQVRMDWTGVHGLDERQTMRQRARSAFQTANMWRVTGLAAIAGARQARDFANNTWHSLPNRTWYGAWVGTPKSEQVATGESKAAQRFIQEL